RTGNEVQPVTKPREDASHRWAKNLRPTYQRHAGKFSPILNYRWDDCRSALQALRDDTGSPFDGIVLEYINPNTGGPSLPTMSAYLQLIRSSEHTNAHRHTASTVYHVAEGGAAMVYAGTLRPTTPGVASAVKTFVRLTLVSVFARAACGPNPQPVPAASASGTTAATPTPAPATVRFGQVGSVSDGAIFIAD